MTGPAPEPTEVVEPAPVAAATCAACGAPVAAADAFCEACGAPQRAQPAQPAVAETVTAVPLCADCGGAVGVDGYCTVCGLRAGGPVAPPPDPPRTPLPRDHVETDLGADAALVTDRGTRHWRNEDDGWVAVLDPATVVAVVCDGVSSSVDPDEASAAAVRAAAGVVVTAGPAADPATTLSAAVAASAAAVAALASDPVRVASTSAPACTWVATWTRRTATGAVLTSAWVGDSRAYWVPAQGPAVPLSVDDSWAAEAIALGADPAAAYADRRAHVITRWLGADAGAVTPHVATLAVIGPGTVCVCSDGLWNYLEDPAAFGDELRRRTAGTPLATARALTDFALAAGGSDNITVAVVPIGAPTP